MTPPKLVITAFGWMLRLDAYGVALHATDRWAADMAARVVPDEGHDCDTAHPDGPCPDDEGAFSEDDLLGLLVRARDGEHPVELMAEFVAGVRAEPGEGTA